MTTGEIMNITTRLLLIACLVLPFAACKKEEAPKKAEVAPLVMPTTNDDTAWGAYVTDVVKRNIGNITNSPYVYYLPAEDSPDFGGGYERLLEKAEGDLARGILEGNMLAFASPASAKMADFITTAFSGIDAGSMKGVKVLYIGNAADNERVKAVVVPTGVDYVFVEAK